MKRFVQTALKRVGLGQAEAQPLASTRVPKALITRSAVRSLVVEKDAVMTMSAAVQAHADGDIIVNAGAAGLMQAEQDLHSTNSSAIVMTAPNAKVESSTIGVLIASKAELGPGVRVLIATREALIIAAALMFGYPLIRYLLQRFAPQPSQAEAEKQPLHIRIGRWLFGFAIRLGITAGVGYILYRRLRKHLDPIIKFLPH
ncbi:MAG: hypothetical protein OHK0050_27580 [Roseiflexaceae bacterium]